MRKIKKKRSWRRIWSRSDVSYPRDGPMREDPQEKSQRLTDAGSISAYNYHPSVQKERMTSSTRKNDKCNKKASQLSLGSSRQRQRKLMDVLYIRVCPSARPSVSPSVCLSVSLSVSFSVLPSASNAVFKKHIQEISISLPVCQSASSLIRQ